MKGPDVIRIVALVGSVLGEVRRVIEEDRKLDGKLKNGLEDIRNEMEMVAAEIEGSDENYHEAAQETRILQLQELAYDIEDFVMGLWVWAPGAYRRMLVAIRGDRRPQQLDRIDHFKERIKILRELKPTVASAKSGCQSRDADLGATYAPEAELVGIAKRKDELLELLLSPAAGGGKLRVISIVGRRGVGKTALARAVFIHACRSDAFDCVAWIEAPRCNDAEPKAVLRKILKEVQKGDADDSAVSADLPGILANKRYLIAIDDVQQANLWNDIKHVLPENDMSSRIIITTSVQSVATSCSSGGYVYTMQDLCIAESQDLFWRKVGLNRSEALEGGLKNIFEKCDGLPLALISVSNHLLEKGKNLEVADCEYVGQSLGKYLASTTVERAFEEMRRSLVQCFESLPEHVDRTCLLSMSMFPKGSQIKKKSLVRKLTAEGLVVGDVRLTKESVAYGCIKKLLDRSIVDSVLIGTNFKVKRCQVHGMMLEFIIHKSIYKNFATLIHNDDCVPKYRSTYNVRRLSIHDGTAETKRLAEEMKLSATRWLTISNSSHDLLDLNTCKLLRLLDLEGCTGLDNIFREKICKLRFLKYLSLRDTDVNLVPEEIQKLKYLETLDIRDTKVESLPAQVFLLPQLAYLFGRFRLPHLSKKTSQIMPCLHTLAGVVIENDYEGLNQTMLHATNLRKVKIWFRAAAPSSNSTFWNMLQKRFMGSKALESLSIDSGDLSNNFLSSINPLCGIRSIKIRGVLQVLPDPTTLSALVSLNELHLVSTSLTCEALSILQILPRLVYLKLAEDRDGLWGGSFIVQSDGFRSLQQLRFEAPMLPQILIKLGGMRLLTSLQLLCSKSSTAMFLSPFFLMTETAQIEHWLGVMGVSHLEHLNEVVLHPSVADSTIQAWRKVAKHHENRPCVKQQPT